MKKECLLSRQTINELFGGEVGLSGQIINPLPISLNKEGIKMQFF
jgi:hypothetical protein